MDLDDRKTIQTPEGLDLDLTLAGLGSRMIAAVVDAILIGLLVFMVAFGAGRLSLGGLDGGIFVQAVVTIAITLVILGYLVGFEALNEGRTPGKRAVGIRVVTTEGDSIGFLAAFLRNLLRVIDFLPAVFIVGAGSILLTKTNQRLGDIAANTIVIRERLPHVDRAELEHIEHDGERWDVARVTADDVDVLRRFAVRRRSIPADRTEQIAANLATKIRPKVIGSDADGLSDTDFLLRVLAQKLE
ncbi:MAG TPA: RDD family protein [Acidimicrobiia bacterium]|jgi:uncharacterized RDD family membrane protein YckC